MWKILLSVLKGEQGGTLAITRKTANTLITAAAFNTNYDEIEAIVNGDVDSTNIEDDAITAAKLGNIVRTDYGILQDANGAIYVETYGLINVGADGVAWGRAGDMLLSSSAVTPDGFTEVSATYEGKFIRISATALTAGGANTHTHAVGSFAGPSHTHTGPSHVHSVPYEGWGFGANAQGRLNTNDGGGAATGNKDTAAAGTGATGADGTGVITGTSAAGDNVPVYISLRMYAHS